MELFLPTLAILVGVFGLLVLGICWLGGGGDDDARPDPDPTDTLPAPDHCHL